MSRRGPSASSASVMTSSTSDHHLDAAVSRQPNGVCRTGFERQHSLPSSEHLGTDGALYQVWSEGIFLEGGCGTKALSGDSRGLLGPQGQLAACPPLIPFVSSQVPPQPRRAAPATPPPPVKRRDREALVISGSGERGQAGVSGTGVRSAWSGCSAHGTQMAVLNWGGI